MKSAIIIVSYNSEAFLEQNLQSVFQQTLPFHQVLVVDNHSSDRSRTLAGRFPSVELVKLPANRGYGGAANAGIARTRADLVMVANPDIILTPDFNRIMIESFRLHPGLHMASPLLLRFDRQTIDSAGQFASRAWYPREAGYGRLRSRFPVQDRDLFSVCGALTVFRRKALTRLEIGGEIYDEDFFLFWEDFDLGWRAQLLGLKIRLISRAVAYHHRSGGLKRGWLGKIGLSLARPGAIKYHLVKNRYLTLIKNFRLRRHWASIPFMLAKDLVWVGTLTFSFPKIIIKLLQDKACFARAREKRRLIKAHE